MRRRCSCTPSCSSSSKVCHTLAAISGTSPGALTTFSMHAERHLSHPQLFVTHSNKAASHLALGQHAAALQVRGFETSSLPATPTLRQLAT